MSDTDTPLEFIGSSEDDLFEFPMEVKRVIGFALRAAQKAGKHPDAKPLKGFGGAGVLEVISDFDGDTFRAVYTVKFKGRGLCAARLSEEIEKRSRDATGRDRQDQVTIETSQRAVCGKRL
jgi:phage-related protein